MMRRSLFAGFAFCLAVIPPKLAKLRKSFAARVKAD